MAFIPCGLFAQDNELTRDEKFKLAHEHISTGDYFKSFALAEEIYDIDLQNKDTNNVIQDLFLLSKVNRSIQLPSIALKKIFKIDDFKKPDDSLLNQRIRNEISYLAEEVGALELALKYKVELNNKGVPKEYNVHRFYFEGNIGSLFIRTNQTSKSLKYFKKQLATAKVLKNPELEIQAKNNIGFYYQKLGLLDSAKVTYEEIIKNHPDTSQYSYHNTCGNLAVVLKELGSLNEAIKYLYIDYNYLLNHNKPSVIQNGTMLLELIYRNNGPINDIKKIYAEIDSKNFINPTNNILEYEISKGRFLNQKLSKVQFNRIDSLKKAVEAENKKKSSIKEKILSAFFESQNELLIEQSAKNIQIKQSQLEIQAKKVRLIIAIGAIVCLLLIITILLWLSQKRNLNANRQLAIKEKEILEQRMKINENQMVDLALDISIRKELSSKISNKIGTIDFENKENGQQQIKEILTELKEFENATQPFELIKENSELLSENFYAKLSQAHPNLTNYEKELCSLIKMGVGNKEISNLKNIAPSSVATSKNRLKNKLNISGDISEYLNSL